MGVYSCMEKRMLTLLPQLSNGPWVYTAAWRKYSCSRIEFTWCSLSLSLLIASPWRHQLHKMGQQYSHLQVTFDPITAPHSPKASLPPASSPGLPKLVSEATTGEAWGRGYLLRLTSGSQRNVVLFPHSGFAKPRQVR